MDNESVHVLVVDDETSIRLNVEAYLEDEGFTVRSAESGEEAVDILKKEKFDIGIIDMRLPGIDGNELILMAHNSNPKMRFIIHTGSTGYVLPQNIKELAIMEEHVLRKPLSDISLITKLIGSIMAGEI